MGGVQVSGADDKRLNGWYTRREHKDGPPTIPCDCGKSTDCTRCTGTGKQAAARLVTNWDSDNDGRYWYENGKARIRFVGETDPRWPYGCWRITLADSKSNVHADIIYRTEDIWLPLA